MNTVAIIGAGVIGAGWAARFYLNGWRVQVLDPSPDAERIVRETVARARSHVAALEGSDPREGALVFADAMEVALVGVDWVQESLPEDIELKTTVLRELDTMVPVGIPICSSTSGFKPSVLGDTMLNTYRLFVCHPFNPVYLLPLVEVVPHADVPTEAIESACTNLDHLGMRPLRVRKEIDGHIADRLLEAMWREALWLVHDDIATTDEVDSAIKYGFGLRWAQMGLFETYRLGGGEAGMRHFLEQFGPALQWPWTKLTDVPDLNSALIEKIANQVEAQTGDKTVTEMMEERDQNLVAIMNALGRTTN